MYSLADTARILRVSPRRLRYWSRTRLVAAAPEQAFGFAELVKLRALVSLLAHGVSVRRIRRSVARLKTRLPELGEPLAALRLWGGDARRVVARHGGALVELDGQLVLEFEALGASAVAVLPTPVAGAPRTAFEWFERGCALDGESAKSPEALEAYRRAIELEPEFADAWCNFGTLHFHRGERSEAQQAYETALLHAPEHLEAHFNLANLLDEAGRREAALHHYKHAVRIDPTFADARLNLALLYDRLALRRLGREQWRQYLKLVPTGSWADLARERVVGPAEPAPEGLRE